MDTNKHESKPFLGKLLDGVTVEWKTLAEVGEFRRGTAITKKQPSSGNIPVIANGPLPTYAFHDKTSNRWFKRLYHGVNFSILGDSRNRRTCRH